MMLSDPLTDLSTKVPFHISYTYMLLTAETPQGSNNRERDVLRPKLETALLEWFLQYEKDGPISRERH